jgi:hypothetical protein
MKPRFTILSLILILSVFVSACGSNSDPSNMNSENMEKTEDSMSDEEMADEEMEDSMEDTMAEEEMASTTFVVRIENIDNENGLTILAPGAFEVNDHPVSFFDIGEVDRGVGLESLAEDGDPSLLVDSVNEMMGEAMMGFSISAFNTPIGADTPGPVLPGGAYEFTFDAHAGQYLTFATMFVQSNDWFFAPDAEGITLFDTDGNPLIGDITDLVYLWNAGTEVDQVVGEGSDQAPRQEGPNTGEAENGLVTRVDSFSDYEIKVTISIME